ncbi:MAG: hypothetical protein H0V70_15965 [Ktedonobacteraceae bacterium]|nr:hypothetical protein [Ktedonobacteraceae bacterium]
MTAPLRPFIGPIELRPVNFGVDTFLVNFKLAADDGKPNGDPLPELLAETLNTWQALARKEQKPMPIEKEYRGKTLSIRPHGSGVWSWLLFNEDVALSLSYGSMNGGVFCQARFASHLLWSIGPDRAYRTLREMLVSWLDNHPIYAQASEIHICTDLQGWYDGPLDWETAFVSRVVNMRARPEEPTEKEQEGGLSPKEAHKLDEACPVLPVVTTAHRRIATLDFGSHGSDIMGQIYNKSQEIKQSKKLWFEPIWQANGWDGSSTIWREEFRIRRKFLAAFDLNEASEVLASIPLLWRYATEEWLRHVDLSIPDTNKSRLPASPIWQAVQRAGLSPDLAPVPLDLVRDEEARLTRLIEEQPLHLLTQVHALSLDERINEEDIPLPLDALSIFTQARTFYPFLLQYAYLWTMPAKLKATAITQETFMIEDSFREVELEVLRDMAREEVERLSPTTRHQLVAYLSPEPFEEVRASLIKRSRTMARKKSCVSSFAGYLTSIMALSPDEEAAQPDLQASLVVAFGEVYRYNKTKGRVYLEEVWKKRLAYGFVTAQQLEEERRLHGLDLSDEDWEAVQAERDYLRAKREDVYLDPFGTNNNK